MAKPLSIVFPLYPGVQSLDVVGPAQVFDSANELAGREVYRLRYVATRRGSVACSAGLGLAAESLSTVPPRGIHTLVVPGGHEEGLRAAAANPRFMGWIATAAPRATRVASVCTGAFLLAALGVLDGRRVATHWNSVRRIAGMFPALSVDEQAIYVRDGHVWTSAGVTAGIDMSLALVEEDMGREVAMAVARALVVYMRRPGHQTQFSSTLAAQSVPHDRLGELATWIDRNLASPLNVEALAARVHMSPRSFHRHVRNALGMTPARFVESLRLDAARRLLDDAAPDLARVAEHAGFSGADHLIRAFSRRFGMTPGAYRELHVRKRTAAANGER